MGFDLTENVDVPGSAAFILVMGVSGAGKSTVGKALAIRLAGRFIEADDFHPTENVERMTEGLPLGDAHRWPWLQAVSSSAAKEMALYGGPVVIACSALKRDYRDVLRKALSPLLIIHLDGTVETIKARLEQRRSHFMPAELLGSQMAILEPPELDENGIGVSIDGSQDEVIANVIEALDRKMSGLKLRGEVG